MPENFLRLRRQPASAPGAVKVESSDKIRSSASRDCHAAS